MKKPFLDLDCISVEGGVHFFLGGWGKVLGCRRVELLLMFSMREFNHVMLKSCISRELMMS